jgi:hypothetical protein
MFFPYNERPRFWLLSNSGQNYNSCILGAFAKLRNVTISFVMSVCPSVRMEQLGSHWTDIHEIWYLCVFRKSVEDIQVSLKSDKNNGYFTWRPLYIYDFAQFFLEWEMYQSQVEKFKLFFPPRKSLHSWDDNMAHAHCKLDTWGYTHTHTHTHTHTEYVILFAFPL